MTGRVFNRRNGSVSLETVLVFPLFLTLMTMVLQGMVIMKLDTGVRNAADNAATELGLVTSAVGAVQNTALAAEIREGLDLQHKPEFAEVWQSLLNIGTTLAADAWMTERTAYWISESDVIRSASRWVSGLQISLEGTLTDDVWFAHVNYDVLSLLGRHHRSFITYVPVRSAFQINGPWDSDSDLDVIWTYHNLERGRIFRVRNGGNLPMGYPVLSGYYNGMASVIRSMDTTAVTWQSESAVYNELVREIDRLAMFTGTESPWGTDRIWIQGGDIHQRTLVLVIPENELSTPTDDGILEAGQYAQALGIEFELRRQGWVGIPQQ